jgi:hypothetical protein
MAVLAGPWKKHTAMKLLLNKNVCSTVWRECNKQVRNKNKLNAYLVRIG